MGNENSSNSKEYSRGAPHRKIQDGLYAYADSLLIIPNKKSVNKPSGSKGQANSENYKKDNSIIHNAETGSSDDADKDGLLVVSDVHLGYDYQYDEVGIRFLLKDDDSVHAQITELRLYFESKLNIRVNKIAFNGDIIDDFALKSVKSRRSINMFFAKISDEFERVYLIRGNHDKMLDTLILKDNCSISEYLCEGGFLLVHGDRSLKDIEISKEDTNDCKAIIMGHEHPVLRLTDSLHEESYKCLVIFDKVQLAGSNDSKGNNSSGRVILMPAFNQNITGTDISNLNFMSPLLSNVDAEMSTILVYDYDRDGFLEFGSIADL